MTDDPTKEEVSKSIEPRSDQLNAEDCAVTGPITVMVTGVRRGSKEQPIVIELEGRDRPFKPCKTCRRVLIALWSNDPKQWVGQQLTIYTDPEVVFGGIKVGGLRISHATGIDKIQNFMFTKTRGKKAEVVIKPIASLTPDEAQYVIVVTGELANTKTEEALKGHGEMLKSKSKSVQDALRPVYKARLEELRKGDS